MNHMEEKLTKGIRADGRKFDEIRKIEIEYNISKNAEGSARCRLGETEVLAGVKLEIGTPYTDSPDEGSIVVNAELGPISNPDFVSGPPGAEATEIARLVDRGIRESKAVDFKKLCIKSGEKVWIFLIDIYTTNDAGNLIDAAYYASLAALKEIRMPKVKDDKIVFGEYTKDKMKLEKFPINFTFGKIGKHIILDPSMEEEKFLDARLTLAVDNKHVHSMQKNGNGSFSLEEIEQIIDIAFRKDAEVKKLFK